MSPIPTGADRDLAHRLSGRGVEATPGQLIGWRQAGLLGEQQVDGRYEPNIVERARAARRLVVRYPRKLYVAVLAMFAEGEFPIATKHLHAAYGSALDQVERDLINMAKTGDRAEIPFAVADALAKRIAREPRFHEMRDRVQRRGRSLGGESRRSILSSIAANLANATVAGRPISDEANAETLKFTGISAPAAESLPEENPFAETLAAWLTSLLGDVQVDGLRAHIATLTADELSDYRDDAVKVGGLMMVRFHEPLDLALGAVAMSLLDRRHPQGYSSLVKSA